MTSMRSVTYVTRKYPPSVGGMETLARNTELALEDEYGDVGLFALGRRNIHLLWWVPVTALRLAADVSRRRSRGYLFGDALAWATLSWIPRLARRPAITMVCGLDITYSGRLYRATVHPRLRRAPRVLAISAATLAQAVAAGVPPENGAVVIMGVETAHDRPPRDRQALEAAHGIPEGAPVLLTTGRLVRRKGVRWFVENVMPRLREDTHYVVVGSGPDAETIEQAATTAGVADRVHLLGYVPDAQRRQLLADADVFVQPNIPVDDDMEGFGLVVVEAAQAGLMTVAADLEGLRDAVRHGDTGYKVASGDAEGWARMLTELLSAADLHSRASAFGARAREVYSLAAMGKDLRQYVDQMDAAPRDQASSPRR
jgi:glycosyltransferase involved in cell wall biosynthesis